VVSIPTLFHGWMVTPSQPAHAAIVSSNINFKRQYGRIPCQLRFRVDGLQRGRPFAPAVDLAQSSVMRSTCKPTAPWKEVDGFSTFSPADHERQEIEPNMAVGYLEPSTVVLRMHKCCLVSPAVARGMMMKPRDLDPLPADWVMSFKDNRSICDVSRFFITQLLNHGCLIHLSRLPSDSLYYCNL
jgi:hypothetical protein